MKYEKFERVKLVVFVAAMLVVATVQLVLMFGGEQQSDSTEWRPIATFAVVIVALIYGVIKLVRVLKGE